jgi:monoterpene epsilon-lactone hydrolase
MIRAALLLSRARNTFFNPDRFSGPSARKRRPSDSLPPRWLGRAVQVSRDDCDGWPVYVISPSPAKGRSRGEGEILYLHGGGYALEINAAQWRFAAALARRTGRTVTVPIYPLTPEHTYRDVFPTLLGVYGRLHDRAWAGGEEYAAPVAVTGDSAGAGMALTLVQMLSVSRRPSDLILLSPWLDALLADPAIDALRRTDALLNPNHLRTLGTFFAAPDDPGIAEVSPINGPLNDLGRLLVFAGTRDLLHLDARRLERMVLAGGGDIDYREYEGMIHDWMLFPVPEARDVQKVMAQRLATR